MKSSLFKISIIVVCVIALVVFLWFFGFRIFFGSNVSKGADNFPKTNIANTIDQKSQENKVDAIQTKDTAVSNTKKDVIIYTFANIAKHNSKNDCWQVIDDKIYDVTSYISEHPGGDKILKGCGKDATNMFDLQHEPNIKSLYNPYYVANLN